MLRIPARRLAASVVALSCLTIVPPSQGADEHLRRELKTVTVEGARETWGLVWEKRPETVCGPREVLMAITCPCSGWAYAEFGKLSLVRSRDGRDVERMDLGPLFGTFDYPQADLTAGSALLQRWPATPGDLDRENQGDPDLVAEIEQRPAPDVMTFADYDRDGAATEFLIQVGTLPCGKHQFAAIGVTKAVPHLHALTSVAHPDTPLMMPMAAWQALRHGPGPTVVETWPCGDHGSEVRRELVVSAVNGAISVRDREYSCPVNGEAETLVSDVQR